MPPCTVHSIHGYTNVRAQGGVGSGNVDRHPKLNAFRDKYRLQCAHNALISNQVLFSHQISKGSVRLYE